MPSVVLRHPDLPGQPIIVDVPVGAYIPDIYTSWVIDSKTSVEDAEAEIDASRASAVQKADDAARDFKPAFAPVDDTSAQPTPVPPAEPVNQEQAPAPLDLSKEI